MPKICLSLTATGCFQPRKSAAFTYGWLENEEVGFEQGRRDGPCRRAALFMTGPLKRSVTIAGHETSLSLEPIFWQALREEANALALPLNALVAQIDADRIEAEAPSNLASAIRVWLFMKARSRLGSRLHSIAD